MFPHFAGVDGDIKVGDSAAAVSGTEMQRGIRPATRHPARPHAWVP